MHSPLRFWDIQAAAPSIKRAPAPGPSSHPHVTMGGGGAPAPSTSIFGGGFGGGDYSRQPPNRYGEEKTLRAVGSTCAELCRGGRLLGCAGAPPEDDTLGQSRELVRQATMQYQEDVRKRQEDRIHRLRQEQQQTRMMPGFNYPSSGTAPSGFSF